MLEILNKYHKEGWLIKQTHPTYDLTIWNYSQTTQYEGKWDDVTKMCRGLVTNNNGAIIAKPFPKFFNMEENKHTPTEDFEVFEKMDGSLGILFCHNGEWVMATRGSFISDQAIKGLEMLKELSVLKNYPTVGLNKDWTYLFEIIYQENRIVCDYDFEGLVLLGAYNVRTLEEIDFKELQKSVGLFTDLKVVRKYDGIKDYSTLKNMVKNNAEGFVVRFSNGDRMKIKGEEYIRLHKIMTNLSTTSVWEVLSSDGSIEDILVNVPDEFYSKIKEYVKELNIKFNDIHVSYYKYYNNIVFKVGIKDRKIFAEEARKYKYSSILFNLLDKKDINNIIWKIIKPEFKKL